MASISSIQGTAESRLTTGQVAETTRPPTAEASPAPGPTGAAAPGRSTEHDSLDPRAVRELVGHLQDAIDRASAEPHQVGFRQDARTKGFVIEIRNLDGSLVRQFPPEKVLNLRRKLADLSGMVVDETT